MQNNRAMRLYTLQFKVPDLPDNNIAMGCMLNKKWTILVLIGSARKKSVNAGLIQEIEHFSLKTDVQVTLILSSLESIPLFNEDLEKKTPLPEEVLELRAEAEESKAILFVTPQINGSVSPLILNAFAWLSRSYDKEKGSPLQSKKAGLISASYLSQNQITDCIEMGKFFDMKFADNPFYLFLGNKSVNESGRLISASEKERLEKWYRQFIHFTSKKLPVAGKQ